MVDEDLLASNPIAIQGLKFLAQSGIIRQQQGRLLERLGAGDPDESDESLVERVKIHRRHFSLLESLQQLGDNYVSEEETK